MDESSLPREIKIHTVKELCWIVHFFVDTTGIQRVLTITIKRPFEVTWNKGDYLQHVTVHKPSELVSHSWILSHACGLTLSFKGRHCEREAGAQVYTHTRTHTHTHAHVEPIHAPWVLLYTTMYFLSLTLSFSPSLCQKCHQIVPWLMELLEISIDSNWMNCDRKNISVDDSKAIPNAVSMRRWFLFLMFMIFSIILIHM